MKRHAAAWTMLGCVFAQEPVVTPKPKPPSPEQQAPKENRLAKETSPYLRQHRGNPVDWYPWGDEAFARAKKEDKPIFLSIGYSACHWCHVMAAESFADAAIAALMNEHFVCIKVDREERPDVDEIYMAAVQAMGQQGGWPLSAWLTPEGKPFFGGTYFPPGDAHGRPGFPRVLQHLAKTWREKRAEVDKGAAELATHLQQALAPALEPGEPDATLVGGFLPRAQERFDPIHGGFAEPPHFAPKFPSARELQVLMRLPDDAALRMATDTLLAMRRGGIQDQLGGGFHRYSTDRAWIVPHFEKMLYDNALLAQSSVEAFERTGDERHAAVARATLGWMLREMRHPGGAFFASQDAQSEGVEGRFFVWTEAEIDALLGEDGAFGKQAFGVTKAGNHDGKNVLVLTPDADTADGLRLTKVRTKLFAAREARVRPGTDDKILCAWNGLAIGALAAGYRSLGEVAWRDAARAAADFVLREMVVDGRCKRHWHSGTARQPGFLEDHAMLAEGLLALFEVDPDPRWLAAARDLVATVRQRFSAPDGSFWFTADDHETLVARTRSPFESSIPSGTAAAVHALLRLGLLLGDEASYDAGIAALRANHSALAKVPNAVPSLLLAAMFHLASPREVVIAGEPDDPRTQALLQAAWRAFPHHLVVAHVHTGNREALEALSPLFAGKVPLEGVPAAYVCRRGVCALPTTDVRKLVEAL